MILHSVLYYQKQARNRIGIDAFAWSHQDCALCTLHRQENTYDVKCLNNIRSAQFDIAKDLSVVVPMVPRTRAKIEQQQSTHVLEDPNILDPLSYLEIQRLQMSAKLMLIDSGGMQKKAYFHRVLRITLGDETEWVETIEAVWNQLLGASADKTLDAWVNMSVPNSPAENLCGDGYAADAALAQLTA